MLLLQAALLSLFALSSYAAVLTKIRPDHPDTQVISQAEDEWRTRALKKLWEERQQMGHTPLVKMALPGFPNADVFFKNETATPTLTLKHRFAWALVMWAVVEGKVNSNSTIYDSTSGNTGASEAYMASLIGIPYVAVVAKELEQAKVDQIKKHGGGVMKVDVSLRNFHAEDEAKKNAGFFINQFGNADRAEEFHESANYKYESSNVFHEILSQLKEDEKQERKIPHYFIHNAGTGGTISSVGRYVTRYGLPTKVVLSDSQYSLFYDYVVSNKFTNESGNTLWVKPGIAGIGYGYNVKPVIFGETTSLVRSVVDEAVKMPDIASAAAMRVLKRRGIAGGASTALNFLVALHKAHLHKDDTHEGSLLFSEGKPHRLTIATLICDPDHYYADTYYNDQWIDKSFSYAGGLEGMHCWEKVIDESIENGADFLQKGVEQCKTPMK